jgi:hypothetical protein
MAGWGIIDDILGAFNLVDLFTGIIQGAAAGDVAGHRIALPHPDADYWKQRNTDGLQVWTLNEVRGLLEGYHVKTYRRGFNSQEIWVHVKRKQARFAEYLLKRAGAPVLMDTVDPRNAQWAANPAHAGKMPARWDDQPRQSNGRYAHKSRRRSKHT